MANLLFYIFAFLTVACAALVVVNKNPVNGAMFLLLSLVGMAGLFVMLDAALLAFVLLLVYAGAVVALFLFIIMLLDTRPEHLKPFKKLSVFAATVGGALLLLGVYSLSHRVMLSSAPPAGPVPTLKNYAEQLFTTYLLPVQVVGFMLLIAMLGVIVLSKKFAPVEDAQ
ncbi:NADH-quinone oxidoreductase subunit J [Oleiharenicola sp. Vm1]|uniref:NADH-quinone oxidoreductase subunit J family protein n=1 Tax=Oleiharenicola sp. Vm1 TaxID=3398393 RepID=UPI0039F526CF